MDPLSSRPGAVVEDCRQPRAFWASTGVGDEDVEFGVICLPGVIGVLGGVPVDEFVLVSVRDRTVESDSHHRRIQAFQDGTDRSIAGCGFAYSFRIFNREPVESSNARAGP